MDFHSRLNPYVGPRPFLRQDKNIFFGRQQEAEKLCTSIIENKITILHSKSGAGKTSLLNALLQDLLEESRFTIFKVDHIGSSVEEWINPDNVFIFNTLLSLNIERDISKLKECKLSTFFEHNYSELANKKFIIIFDRFEDVFTSHLDRWKDRYVFFEEMKILCKKFPLSRILLSIPEDYLGYLLDGFYPEKNSVNYYHLELLNKNNALSAVKGPLISRKYADGVAEEIINQLFEIKYQDRNGNIKIIEGEFIEPVHLQIVCKTLWDSLAPSIKIIEKSHLFEIGGVNKVIEDYYEASIFNALQKYPFDEYKIRNWISSELITEMGTRGIVLYGKSTEGIPGSIIDSLLESYIIKSEKRAGARWISLSHDRLIDPILNSNQKFEINELKSNKMKILKIKEKEKEKINNIKKPSVKIFISYVREDEKMAMKIYQKLSDEGYEA